MLGLRPFEEGFTFFKEVALVVISIGAIFLGEMANRRQVWPIYNYGLYI